MRDVTLLVFGATRWTVARALRMQRALLPRCYQGCPECPSQVRPAHRPSPHCVYEHHIAINAYQHLPKGDLHTDFRGLQWPRPRKSYWLPVHLSRLNYHPIPPPQPDVFGAPYGCLFGATHAGDIEQIF